MSRLRQYGRGSLLFDVRDEGPVDGESVVLLHGFPQSSAAYDKVVPALHGGGLRTLVPDQRGYSAGARPAARAAYRLEWLVADVLALLDAAGLERAHVVGHDWGGGVAWALASAHPDRVASLTALSTPHPRAMVRSMLNPAQLVRSSYMLAFQVPRLPEAALGERLEAALRDSGLPAPDAARYAALMDEPGALTAALNWYRALPLTRLDVGPVQVPTTFLWGNRDPYLSRSAAERTGDHVEERYRFVELPAGHWLPEREPDEVSAAILDLVGTG
ncbi:alpha/beta fold hydrolase [Georgenia muralis]|uniref:Pimeloyl-ACP methyl ester carboxylesterase n=1 Tax=Georgenia muralis TaxID=154117 RepID=A0A3N4Z4Y1_9MICO|nr:alpha/beta fold hydrolase [Georgenia muralis]RPF26180.1 pimeloyl-ACP methyl ester carboxylesterase [Georgenia muralis]